MHEARYVELGCAFLMFPPQNKVIQRPIVKPSMTDGIQNNHEVLWHMQGCLTVKTCLNQSYGAIKHA